MNGGGMAILSVLTAWWSVGTAARVVRRRPRRDGWHNLEIRTGKLALAFTRSDWPRPVSHAVSWRLALAAAPFGVVAVWFLVGVGWRAAGD